MSIDLETRLVRAIDDLDVSETDLAEAVLDQLATADPIPLAPRRNRPPIAWAAAVVMIIIAVSTITPAREAVANWLGIGATQVEIDSDFGPLPSASSVTSLGKPAPATDDLISPIAGLPDAFDRFENDERGQSYVWPASDQLPAIAGTDVGAVLSIRANTEQLAGKIGTIVDTVTIDFDGVPRAAIWIDGPHLYLPPGSDEPLGAARVLLWEADGLEYRLESNLGLDDTLALFSP